MNRSVAPFEGNKTAVRPIPIAKPKLCNRLGQGCCLQRNVGRRCPEDVETTLTIQAARVSQGDVTVVAKEHTVGRLNAVLRTEEGTIEKLGPELPASICNDPMFEAAAKTSLHIAYGDVPGVDTVHQARERTRRWRGAAPLQAQFDAAILGHIGLCGAPELRSLSFTAQLESTTVNTVRPPCGNRDVTPE